MQRMNGISLCFKARIMYKLITTFCFLLLSLMVMAQAGSIRGTIISGDEPVPFVNVGLKGTNIGASTDLEGKFAIDGVAPGNYILQASSVGMERYRKAITVEDKPVVVAIEMKEAVAQLGEIVVTGTMKETYVSQSPVKVEVLTAKFLETTPTSNIMEALQTVNGVQEQINCGVCATNDIHINGMEGPYTLVLIDGMPIMSALASVYGFNGIPTSLIERVEIVKGPSSTLYGTEAVGGVINVITRKPEKMPIISTNTFYTSHRELNADVAITPKIGKDITTTISGNYYKNDYRMDFNNDNFTDVPLNDRISIFNKWTIKRKEDRTANVAFRYYTEDRFGGTLQWNDQDRGSDEIYGESILTNRYEIIGSYQLPFKEMVRVDFSYNNHHQDSYYGDTHYLADQSVYFSNLVWNKTIKRHDILTGLTYRYQTYADNSLANTDDERLIPGIFVQDEFMLTENTTLLGGTRFDYHEEHGAIISPRVNLKRKFGTYTTARLNLGTGFRQVNLFTEDHAALTGARTVVIKNNLDPEESYNATLNLNHVYAIKESYGTIDLDFFYTYFTNKIIPDYELDPNLIVYDNLSGYGITRGAAFNVEHKFVFPLKVKLGGTIQDVYEIAEDDNGNDVREEQLFAPKFSGVFALGYQFKKLNLSVDYTGRLMGPQHLPTFEFPFSRPETSPWFSIQNIQLTKSFSEEFEVYLAVKNLFNYTQPSPLIDPANPFGLNFDTSYAYGPLQVRRYLLGIRWNVLRK